MRGVVHRRQTGPVIGPAFHVLLVTGFQELYLAQLAFFVQLLDKKEFAGVDYRFHHHIFQARFLADLHDFHTIFYRGSHGYRAGDVLARPQGFQRLFGVVRNGGIDVYGVHLGIGQQVVVAGVAHVDAIFVANGVKL